MADYDLPPVPDVQLQMPELTMPGPPPLSLGGDSHLTLDPQFLGPGGGSPSAMALAFGHYTDPPMPGLPPLPAMPGPPGVPPYLQPGLAPGLPPLQLHGLPGPLDDAVNPWLRDPMGVAEQAERERLAIPQIDPGVAAQQTIIHSPTFRF